MRNPLSMPKPIVDKLNDLQELVSIHQQYIPLPEVAAFLRMKPDTLRSSIDKGQCPFGLGGQLGINRAYKIPTVPFYLWFTQGCGWRFELSN